eukprot:2234717-Rhodomonas_salina.2
MIHHTHYHPTHTEYTHSLPSYAYMIHHTHYHPTRTDYAGSPAIPNNSEDTIWRRPCQSIVRRKTTTTSSTRSLERDSSTLPDSTSEGICVMGSRRVLGGASRLLRAAERARW